MSMHPDARDQTIADYLAVVRRYKWLILVVTIVVPVVAYALSAREQEVYRATADVLINRQDLGTTVTGLSTQTSYTDPERYMRNQAALARVPEVAAAAIADANLTDRDGSDLLGSSDVTPRTSADVLTFNVYDNDATIAGRLVAAYAKAFTEHRLRMETTGLAKARREVQARVAEMRAAGNADAETYTELVRKVEDLRILEYLQAPASVLRAAPRGAQVAPTPQRNATLGLLLGVVLGIGGAFLLHALDRRVRHADEVEHELQIPLLAKLPTPGRGDAATILERAPDETTESIGRLRASFDFTNQNLGAKTVMVTSAGPREGKSTTVANLAIALARAGRHVVLVDLDLRRPMLSRLLHLPDGPGITDLAARDTELVDALQPVGVTPLRARIAPIGSPGETGQGRLEVITTGRTRVEPAAFVESTGLTEALHTLRSYAEIVLIDAPPILATGDSIALTGKVDAILLITRLGTLTRPTLQELGRVLRRSPVPVLGIVATGAEIDEGYSVYAVDEYYSQVGSQPEMPPARLEEVPEVRSASGGSTRWTPRRGG
jgi:capsular exopolysaccharide synthesis family protein